MPWGYNPPDFRGNQCPARAGGLNHTADSDDNNKCLHCGRPITKTPPAGVPDSASEAQRVHHAEVFDHHYVFTLTGRCGFKDCGKFSEQHAAYKVNTEPGDCTVDHKSVKPWSECRICGAIVEPKLARGTPDGKASGRGRLPASPRDYDRWRTLRKAHEAGYFQS